MQALKTLAGRAAGDVRSCLNTLQLLSARHDVVTGAHVAAAPVGDKDMTAAPFAVWGKLLSSRPPRPSDMLSHLMSFGEHDLVRDSAAHPEASHAATSQRILSNTEQGVSYPPVMCS